VFHRGEVLLCFNGCEELLELVACELGSVVCDYYLGNSETSKDILLEKSEDGFSGYVRDCFCFYPFRELVDSDDQEFALAESCRKRPEDVNAPPREGPRGG
jgi:hypothetical protein